MPQAQTPGGGLVDHASLVYILTCMYCVYVVLYFIVVGTGEKLGGIELGSGWGEVLYWLHPLS